MLEVTTATKTTYNLMHGPLWLLFNESIFATHCLASAFFLSFFQSPSDLKVLAFYIATKVVLYEWCQVLLSACNMPFPSSAMAVQGPENEIEMGAVGAGQSGGGLNFFVNSILKQCAKCSPRVLCFRILKSSENRVSSSDIVSIVLLQRMQSLCDAVYLFNNFLCPQVPCLPTLSVLTTLSLPNHIFLKLSVLLFAHCKSD